MLPLGLNLHFSRVHFATLVADAVQAAPKNRVYRAYWQAQKSQNLAGGGRGHGFWGGSETRALRAKIALQSRTFKKYGTLIKIKLDSSASGWRCVTPIMPVSELERSSDPKKNLDSIIY